MATRSTAVETGSVVTAQRALRRGRVSGWRILPFLGPAFVASVAYIDPGNFATNIAGGAKFGFTLCWVILASNLMAMLIQTLSAKLGIATGRNLPEVCRERFSHRTSIGLW
ncbi:MAG TPA: Nramp family divalent metal transporter, partial [Gaiellaceae bacterium]|nr:Nramp family divalent metal transporter [Gaiellaceae bacterium]